MKLARNTLSVTGQHPASSEQKRKIISFAKGPICPMSLHEASPEHRPAVFIKQIPLTLDNAIDKLKNYKPVEKSHAALSEELRSNLIRFVVQEKQQGNLNFEERQILKGCNSAFDVPFKIIQPFISELKEQGLYNKDNVTKLFDAARPLVKQLSLLNFSAIFHFVNFLSGKNLETESSKINWDETFIKDYFEINDAGQIQISETALNDFKLQHSLLMQRSKEYAHECSEYGKRPAYGCPANYSSAGTKKEGERRQSTLETILTIVRDKYLEANFPEHSK